MHKTVLLIFFLILMGTMACDENLNPAQEASPPGIKIDFTPHRTQDSVKFNLADIDTTIKDLDEIYNEKKENGEDTTEVLEKLEFYIEKSDSLEKLFNQFERGIINLDGFRAEEGNFVASYQDTVGDIFNFPLNPNDNSTTFYFDYYNIQDTITLNYHLVSKAGTETISLLATEVEVPYHTFDSLSRHFCQEINCNSSEITYKVYF